jgi:hypothetical protein
MGNATEPTEVGQASCLSSIPMEKPLQQYANRDKEKLAIAGFALLLVLTRIKGDEEIRFRMGAGSQTFAKLTEAYALLTGQKPAEVQEAIIPGSSAFHNPPTA